MRLSRVKIRGLVNGLLIFIAVNQVLCPAYAINLEPKIDPQTHQTCYTEEQQAAINDTITNGGLCAKKLLDCKSRIVEYDKIIEMSNYECKPYVSVGRPIKIIKKPNTKKTVIISASAFILGLILGGGL